MRFVLLIISMVLLAGTSVRAAERFPAPEFRTDYKLPGLQVNAPPSAVWNYVDTTLLAVGLGAAAWLVFKRRSRKGVFLLMVASLIYFGFVREGCVCPIGAIQNVALAASGRGYALPWMVAAFFVLPLLVTLFYGRVFCAGVCPLGGIQDAVLWKPVQLPVWVEQALGLFAYIYLGLAVLVAYVGSDFLICRYDPFVGFFRFSASANMVFLGVVLLAIGMFIGRPYCRFICPYSVLLRMLSPFSKHRVSISPKDCVDCRLCEKSCPFGALRYPTPADLPRDRKGQRKQLVMAIALVPVLLAVFAWGGHRVAPALSRLDFNVRLAERVHAEEQKLVTGTTEESSAFKESGVPAEQLYQKATGIQKRYSTGSVYFGLWMGLVVGMKLIGLVLRQRQSGYTADAAGCVACARCYVSCPVEHERTKAEEAEGVVA